MPTIFLRQFKSILGRIRYRGRVLQSHTGPIGLLELSAYSCRMDAEIHGDLLQAGYAMNASQGLKFGVAPAESLRRYCGVCSGDGVDGSSGKPRLPPG